LSALNPDDIELLEHLGDTPAKHLVEFGIRRDEIICAIRGETAKHILELKQMESSFSSVPYRGI
jgi:hypothetical protein